MIIGREEIMIHVLTRLGRQEISFIIIIHGVYQSGNTVNVRELSQNTISCESENSTINVGNQKNTGF